VHWIHLAGDSVNLLALVNTELNKSSDSVNDGNFFSELLLISQGLCSMEFLVNNAIIIPH
jgi:hypothetical protein